MTVTPAGATAYTWANPSTATPALEVPGGASRIAAAWYASSSFTVDVDVTNGQSYNLELYVLDYNGGNARSEQIQLSNAGTGAVLSTETVSNFTNGAYLNWTISGNVLITITKTAGANAVLSGLFFDPPTASATFLEQDTTREGSWIGVYGTDGYDVINNPSTSNPNSLPAGVTVTPAGATTYTWANPSTATPALEVPGGASRIAAAWYASSSFTVDVDVTNGQSYNLELYVLDYNGGNARSEQIQLSNASTGAVLSTETVSDFTNGAYLNWTISGNVLITITKTAGNNAVLSGLFLDPPPSTTSATFLEQDTTTEGSWIGVYGTDGYDVINNPSTSHPNSLPAGVTVTPAGATTYTWANPSTATPALEVPGGASRIAAAWYASSSFTVDVDVTNGQSYNLELYVLDYNGGNARSEQIQLSNAGTGAVLSTETVSNFTNGAYLNWTISGNVLITITKTAGNNAVLSGLFLDPVTDGEQSIKASSVAQQAVAMQTEGSASYGSPAPTAIGTLEFSSNDSQPILFADSRSVVVEVVQVSPGPREFLRSESLNKERSGKHLPI